ncbi:hypothetical protein [Microbulbifer yueqingensis]|uniref:Uncharacterized protein n=1 Tax=Microbulbifer yueqingensis TaxID=658219 RepID=A0A1G9BZF6_9GAMM|nr:hypothetical protein [Microbulbifer yueqingensis]SDK44846.1 hypothetical protein SAMN05216212_2421 [Microbulbifer yueqingensis]
MKLRFLCANHRRWLVADLHRAERAMLAAMEEGEGLLAQEGPERALAWFGCAFELADCLLARHWPEQGVAVCRFSDTARLLLATAARLDDRTLCGRVVALARQRLLGAAPGAAEPPAVPMAATGFTGWPGMSGATRH